MSKLEELIAERDRQKNAYESEYQQWEESMSAEEKKELQEKSDEIQRKKWSYGTIIAIVCVIIPTLIFFISYQDIPFKSEYMDAESSGDELGVSDYALMATCGTFILPIAGVQALIALLGGNAFDKKKEELVEKYPEAHKSDSDLEFEVELENIKSGDSNYTSARTDFTECPQCSPSRMVIGNEIHEMPVYMDKLSTGGRAAKGLARGFAKYARWEAGMMGTGSIVGRSGGTYDSMTADAKYRCPECGYKM